MRSLRRSRCSLRPALVAALLAAEACSGQPAHAGTGKADTGPSARRGRAATATGGARGAAYASNPPIDDAGEPAPSRDACDVWRDEQQPARARQALQRLGLFGAAAVVEGVLGARSDWEGRPVMRVGLTHVWYGWTFLESTDVLVAMDPATYAELGAGARVVLGLGGPGVRPMFATSTGSGTRSDAPLWDAPWAVVGPSDIDAMRPLLGYTPWKASAVGVARVIAQDLGQTKFQVLETLAGALPSELTVNWDSSAGLPFPRVSDAEYIVSLEFVDGPAGISSISDIRPHDAGQRALVERALADWRDSGSELRAYYDRLQRAIEAGTSTRTAWLYHNADAVVRAEVTGRASECCSNAGGLFEAHDVLKTWRGTIPPGPLVTFVRGEAGLDACGDRFIYALRFVPKAALGLDGFACGATLMNATNASPGASYWQRVTDSPANGDAVTRWVASPPPLYQLLPPERAYGSVPFAVPSATALWSAPLEPEAALAAAELVHFEVEAVAEHPEGHELTLATPFAPEALAHLPVYEAKLFLACGDPRLFDSGQRWLAPIADLTNSSLSSSMDLGAELSSGQLFIVPGLLVPDRDEFRRTNQIIRSYPNAALNMPVNPP